MTKAEIEKLLEPLCEQENAELVDLSYAKEGPRWVLRVFLDKPNGLTLDDCAYFSERIGALIDSAGAIDRAYVLEVSSPGLDRVIKKPKDFERFAGKTVRVRLRSPLGGQRNFKGVLKGMREGRVAVDCETGPREFELGEVDEARLEYRGDL